MSIKKLIFNYRTHWKSYIVSIILSLICGYVYKYNKKAVYFTNAKIIIKGDNNGTRLLPSNLGLPNLSYNNGDIDNQIEILTSLNIVQKTVEERALNIFYYRKNSYKEKEIYKQSPVQCYMTKSSISRLILPLNIEIESKGEELLTISTEIDNRKIIKSFRKLPAYINTPYGNIYFFKNTKISGKVKQFFVRTKILSYKDAANQYLKHLSLEQKNKNTTIVTIGIHNENPLRGIDFIYGLINQYNDFINNYQNENSKNITEFIDNRIESANYELEDIENKIAEIKGNAGVTFMPNDAQSIIKDKSDNDNKKINADIHFQIIQRLYNFAINPKNKWQILPIKTNLNDIQLSQLINKYNEMLLKRRHLLLTSADNNPTIININQNINSLRECVLTTISSIYESLRIQKNILEKQVKKNRNKIISIPQNELKLLAISRQESIKIDLLKRLLILREKKIVTMSCLTNKAQFIEYPNSTGPISISFFIIYIVCFIIGLLLPSVISFMNNLLKYKINNSNDIIKITDIPIIGEVPKFIGFDNYKTTIVVKENINDIAAETYRQIRTNLIYMLGKNGKIILFTSTKDNEGKSFNVANTAMSFATLGKKVLVIGLDLRKTGINVLFGMSNCKFGLIDYISDPYYIDIKNLIIKSNINNNLFYLFSGKLPLNPTETIAKPFIDLAIDRLKIMFDYILIDTTSIGTFSDTLCIAHLAEASVYIVKENYTTKNELSNINNLKEKDVFKNLSIIINEVK